MSEGVEVAPRKGIAMHRNRHALAVGLFVAAAATTWGCGSGTAPSGAASSTPGLRPTLALVNGSLIDGTGAAPVRGAVVLIAGDRIVAAGPAARVEVPAGVETVDVAGATILPGFINAHVHYAFDRANLAAWARGGVTTVRDESASVSQVSGLKAFRAEAASDPKNAGLISAGTMLAVLGGYGYLYFSSAAAARSDVQAEIGSGVDAVKVALEDGYAGTRGLPKPTPEELRAIVDTAHAAGLPVSGHITQAAYFQPMLDAGVDDIAHLPYDPIAEASLQEMVDRGVYVIPTFTVFRNYGAPMDGCVDNLRRIVALGGMVALGNDYGGGPGEFELGMPMYEIEMMSRAGMTPMQIIEAGTRNGAHVLRRDSDLGTIEPGKLADVLVVGGDPLADLHELSSVRLVVHGGAVIRDEIRV
jgi:imidazolonepropionase-like amidohydrolase